MNPFPTPEARELMEYMSNLSEEAYCARWMQDLEYELWSAIIGGAKNYGRPYVDDGVVDRLRTLSERAGGWIVFDDVDNHWGSFSEWLALFNNWSGGR